MTAPWPTQGACGACGRPAQQFPSGKWEHHGNPCRLRSQTLFRVAHVVDRVLTFDPPTRQLLVFVPDGDELPQPEGHSTADRDRMIARFPDDAQTWREFYDQPTEWDRVRAELAADAEAGEEA